MPSFADIKAKASKVASSGVEKAQHVRDRNTSVPMKKTNWDPYSGAPPPPPPPKANLNSKPKALAPLLPPPSRTGSSISSASTSSTAPSRGPSTTSLAAPSLPTRRAFSGDPPPPLPRRTNTLEPPPLPGRGASAPSASFGANAPSPTLPPPSRTPANHAAPSPPPLKLTTKPGSSPAPPFPGRAAPPRQPPPITAKSPSPAIQVREAQETPEIDWANLSEEDKQVFFSWLDDFFTRLLGVPVGPERQVMDSNPRAAIRCE